MWWQDKVHQVALLAHQLQCGADVREELMMVCVCVAHCLCTTYVHMRLCVLAALVSLRARGGGAVCFVYVRAYVCVRNSGACMTLKAPASLTQSGKHSAPNLPLPN